MFPVNTVEHGQDSFIKVSNKNIELKTQKKFVFLKFFVLLCRMKTKK